MKIGIDEAIKIVITTKYTNSKFQTIDEFKLPIIVGKTTSGSNELNLSINLMKDEKLDEVLAAINKNKDSIDFVSIKIDDKEPLILTQCKE